MEDLPIRKNLRRTGHLLMMPTDRMPRKVATRSYPKDKDYIGANVAAIKKQSKEI